MIVSADTSKALNSFREFQKTFDRKMNNVVREFAYIITEEAIRKTPIGNAQAFMQRYIARQQSLGLNPEEGFARGSWQVSNSNNFTIQSIYGANSGTQALTLAQSKLSGLTFRDNIFIGNRGYYIQLLENNHSVQTLNLGITKPTLDAVISAYRISIKSLYDKG